jgi:hypothetical protein
MLLGLVSTENLQGQIFSRGEAGIVAGMVITGVGIGIGVTYLISHNRGIATGVFTETGGRRVLTTGSKAHSLIETGPACAWGVSESSGRFSKWRQLEGGLAFAVYGRKIGTAAH